MNAKKKIIDFYTRRKKAKSTLINYDELKTNDVELNKKLDEFAMHNNNGFFDTRRKVLLKFIEGHKEIENFAEQFIKLYEYNQINNKYANTLEKFIINYGTTLGTEKYNQKMKLFQGENNPGYKHDGKMSPWKKGSINYSKDAKKKAKDNRSYTTRIDYWIKKGYSQDEAKQKLSERQSTFSYDKCIEKYGMAEGTKVFKKRQEKWQNTLNSKSPEEIDRIRMLKGTGCMNKLYASDPTLKKTPGILYYIRFFDDDIEFWKIGITSKTIEERFARSKLQYEVIFQDKDTFYNCYKKEQQILRDNMDLRLIIDHNGFQTTEAFIKDIYAI